MEPMQPMQPIDRFEFSMSELEKGLNVAGYVPGVNILSGGLRASMGKLQLIAGLAIGCLALLGSELSTDATKRKKLDEISARAFEHAKHGLANFFRGIIESSTPFLVGGVGMYLFYDMHHYRMDYEGERKAKEILGVQEDFSLSSLSSLASELRSMYA